MELALATLLRAIEVEATYQRRRMRDGEWMGGAEIRIVQAHDEIARLRTKLEQIRQAVGPVEQSGRCINCDTVRVLARVALEGI